MNDPWAGGHAYEMFMGRWSHLIARRFLKWLEIPSRGNSWLDIGCGTGTLTRLILNEYQPGKIIAVDPSNEFISFARRGIVEDAGLHADKGVMDNLPPVYFAVGQAQSLALVPDSIDVVVSGLVLNFIPQPEKALEEMIRVAKPGGVVGIFLWDYADGMQMLRYFWDAAVKLDAQAATWDEGFRFPLCREGQLESLVRESVLENVQTAAVEVRTAFKEFDDFWFPFLGKAGPAPNYVTSLSSAARQKLETELRASLPIEEDGTIDLVARAWAIKGTA